MTLRCLPTLLNPLRRKLGRVYADGAYDSKASHRLIARKGATACIPPRKNAGLWKKGHPRNEAVCAGDAQGRAGALEEDIGVSPSFAGRDSDVPVQTVNGRPNHPAKIQWSSGRSDGVSERDKQTEHPWSACQKAPSVTVTWGWGNHDLLADLGNNAVCHDKRSPPRAPLGSDGGCRREGILFGRRGQRHGLDLQPLHQHGFQVLQILLQR